MWPLLGHPLHRGMPRLQALGVLRAKRHLETPFTMLATATTRPTSRPTLVTFALLPSTVEAARPCPRPLRLWLLPIRRRGMLRRRPFRAVAGNVWIDSGTHDAFRGLCGKSHKMDVAQAGQSAERTTSRA